MRRSPEEGGQVLGLVIDRGNLSGWRTIPTGECQLMYLCRYLELRTACTYHGTVASCKACRILIPNELSLYSRHPQISLAPFLGESCPLTNSRTAYHSHRYHRSGRIDRSHLFASGFLSSAISGGAGKGPLDSTHCVSDNGYVRKRKAAKPGLEEQSFVSEG
jgi:hypothetical protein